MKPIGVSKVNLIISLQNNKTRYLESFNAVMDAWKTLDDKYQEDYRNYSEKIFRKTLTDKDIQPYPPPKPVDRTESYDFYIDFFSTDEDEDQELNESDFRRFYKDDWEWKPEHRETINWYLDASNVSANSLSASTIATLQAY